MIFRSIYWTILLSIICAYSANSQNETHPSHWDDIHTIKNHLTENTLCNLIYGIIPRRTWNAEKSIFESTLLKGLCYPLAKGRKLKVLGSTPVYFRRDLMNDPDILDSLFEKEEVLIETELSYDQRGYLVEYQRKFDNDDYIQTRLIRLDYSWEGENITEINCFDSGYYYVPNSRYSSIYIGDLNNEPLLQTSKGWTKYIFENGTLKSTQSEYEKYSNGKLDAKDCRSYTDEFLWDSKGRLLRSLQSSKCDTTKIVYSNEFKYEPFNLTEAQEIFPILKTASVRRWVQLFDQKDLYISETGQGTYLMHNYEPMIKFDTTEYWRQNIYYTIEEPGYIKRVVAEVRSLPEPHDTIPYDPNFKPALLDVRYTQCSIEEIYQRPPGLLDAGRIEAFNKKENDFKNWKHIVYCRDSETSIRFAIGFEPGVYMNPSHNAELFVDDIGRVNYYFKYGDFYKIYW
ncbi:MAG: hypothetical protein MRY83_08710 [Flavobacteriales bacterium]|nr:hypothetical protein [Flavobacteriales bacterium]